MNFERGDSVKFGEKWCKEHGRDDLVNQVVKFTPQWFEDDNGLYTYETECPGIYDEESQEADSIYHIFGNDFENFMDCELIKGTDEDKEIYQKIIQDQRNAEEKYWNEYVKKHLKGTEPCETMVRERKIEMDKKKNYKCVECGSKEVIYDAVDVMGDGSKEENFGKTAVVCKNCGIVIDHI